MTSFEKYQASAEARRTTHGEHIDKLTGYFLAETNRMREQHEAPQPQEPQATSQPADEPVRKAHRRLAWWRWRRGS